MNLQDLLSRLWQGLPLQPAPPNSQAGDVTAPMSDPLTQTMLKANSSVPWLVPGFQQGNIPGGTGNLWGLPGKPNASPPLVLGPNTTMARPAEQEAFPFDPKPKLGTSRPLTDADKLGLLMELANSTPQKGQKLPSGIQPVGTQLQSLIENFYKPTPENFWDPKALFTDAMNSRQGPTIGPTRDNAGIAELYNQIRELERQDLIRKAREPKRNDQ
jgi:hypothetical protein